MGCNCKKENIPLSLRKSIRQKTKEKISEVKKLWNASRDNSPIGVVTSNKDELGFKQQKGVKMKIETLK